MYWALLGQFWGCFGAAAVSTEAAPSGAAGGEGGPGNGCSACWSVTFLGAAFLRSQRLVEDFAGSAVI